MTIRFELAKYLQHEGHPLSPRFSFDRNAINLELALTYQAKGVHVAKFFRNVQKVHTLSKETRLVVSSRVETVSFKFVSYWGSKSTRSTTTSLPD